MTSWTAARRASLSFTISQSLLRLMSIELVIPSNHLPGGSDGKEAACNAGDLSSIPGSGRSPGEGYGNPLQYSCLENSMDRGVWTEESGRLQSMGLQRVGNNWVTWLSFQPSYPLSPTSLALNLSQHQIFLWVSSSHQVCKSSGASASASVLPTNIQGWFPLRLTGLISFLSKGLSRVFFKITIQKKKTDHNSKVSVLQHSAFFMVQLGHLYVTARKNHSFDYMYLCWQSDIYAF